MIEIIIHDKDIITYIIIRDRCLVHFHTTSHDIKLINIIISTPYYHSRIIHDTRDQIGIIGGSIELCPFRGIGKRALPTTRPSRLNVAAEVKNVYLSYIMLDTRKRVYCHSHTTTPCTDTCALWPPIRSTLLLVCTLPLPV